MDEKQLNKLTKDALDAGWDLPEDPSGKDAMPDVAEVEVIDYGDSE